MSGPDADLRVSAVLPAYEEAGALDWVVERTREALRRWCRDWEVIVVVHASARDGTPALAARWARQEPRLRVVTQPAGRRGYGKALALGFDAARLPWIFLCDADGQLDPLDFPLLAQEAGVFDLVAGVRSPRVDPPPRRLAAWVYNRLLRLLLGVRLRDADCAFKLVRRDALRSGLRLTHLADGEIAARIFAAGGRWREVAVTHHPRLGGRSQVEAVAGLPRPGLVLAVLREILALRLELRREASLRRRSVTRPEGGE